MFCPLDMTDHEEAFVGWNELPHDVPISATSWLTAIMPEPHGQSDQLVEIADLENRYLPGTGATYQALVQERAAVEEEDECEGEYGAEGGDDDYGDEDEEGEGDEGEAEYGDYGEEEPEDPNSWENKKDQINSVEPADRFFLGTESLRSKYNDNEVDAFMRLLAVKPNAQWQDESTHHYKLGVHTYEDVA